MSLCIIHGCVERGESPAAVEHRAWLHAMPRPLAVKMLTEIPPAAFDAADAVMHGMRPRPCHIQVLPTRGVGVDAWSRGSCTAELRCDRAAYASVERVAVDAQLMQHVDRIHALLGDGFAPPESLSSYLDFLDSMPHGVSISPKVTVAVALIDNVLAIDELKLEQRRLRCALDALETATYELLVRIR